MLHLNCFRFRRKIAHFPRENSQYIKGGTFTVMLTVFASCLSFSSRKYQLGRGGGGISPRHLSISLRGYFYGDVTVFASGIKSIPSENTNSETAQRSSLQPPLSRKCQLGLATAFIFLATYANCPKGGYFMMFKLPLPRDICQLSHWHLVHRIGLLIKVH